jgi:phosphatidate cytidylyltransferase
LVSAVLIPLALWLFYTGGIILQLFLGLASAAGMWEYRKILFHDKPASKVININISFCLFVFISNLRSTLYPQIALPTWVVLTLFLAIQSMIWLISRTYDQTFKDYLLTLWGLIYLAIFPALIFRIDVLYHYEYLLLLLIMLIWVTDSAAYFIGMRFGKHRGIFPVSPMKSLEGFIAGFIAPFVFVVLLHLFVPNIKLQLLLIAAVSAGLFGQMGDLLESKIKRMGKVKDSSNLIPGHGGILDRFDSLLIAGPVMYCLLTLIA